MYDKTMEQPRIHLSQLKSNQPQRMGPPPGFEAPSKKWYGLAALLFVVGVLGGTTWIILTLHFVRPEVLEMVVPGTMSYEASEPGRYSLIGRLDEDLGRANWTEDAAVSGLQIMLTEEQTGVRIPVQATLGWREKGEVGDTRFSLGSFQMKAPGRVVIRAQGITPIRSLGVQRAQADRLMWALVGGLLLNAMGWLVAPIVVFQVYYRRARAEFLAAEYGA
jgi:hypothetical protein